MPSGMDDPVDSQIIRQVLEGHVNAFEILLKRYQRQVFKIVGGHVPRDMVPEVASEVFVRAYIALPGYAARNTFGSWLTGIAVRSCYDYWRKE
jgi:RNA polymerase sigma-70 factor, ECF subfamily